MWLQNNNQADLLRAKCRSDSGSFSVNDPSVRSTTRAMLLPPRKTNGDRVVDTWAIWRQSI